MSKSKEPEYSISDIDLSDFTLFEPKDTNEINDLRIDYPELKEESAFKDLKPRELKWVWLYANRTSPVFKLYQNKSKAERARVCAEIVFGKKHDKVEYSRKLYEADFSGYIVNAIERMAKFQPSIRLRGRLMNEYIYDKLQSIILITENEMKAMGPDDRKKYASLIIDIANELPTLIEKIELGFGITFKYKDKEIRKPANIGDIINDIDN